MGYNLHRIIFVYSVICSSHRDIPTVTFPPPSPRSVCRQTSCPLPQPPPPHGLTLAEWVGNVFDVANPSSQRQAIESDPGRCPVVVVTACQTTFYKAGNGVCWLSVTPPATPWCTASGVLLTFHTLCTGLMTQ